MDVLLQYDYPGNIRELANLMERLVVMAESDHIKRGDLPAVLLNSHKEAVLPSFISDSMSLTEAVERFERLFIEAAIKKYGSQRKAAIALNVDHGTVSRKMRKSVSEGGVILHNKVYFGTQAK